MGQFVDITGSKFGQWTAIETYHGPSNGQLLWRVHCTCGNTSFVTRQALESGASTKCKECYHKNRHIKMLGQKYGKWTVVRALPKKLSGPTVFVAECECGILQEMSSSDLLATAKRGGGCLNCANTRRIDMTGQTIGRLTILRLKQPQSLGHPAGPQWICRCFCGHEFVLRSAVIRRNNRTSPAMCSRCRNGKSYTLESGWPESISGRCAEILNTILILRYPCTTFEISCISGKDIKQVQYCLREARESGIAARIYHSRRFYTWTFTGKGFGYLEAKAKWETSENLAPISSIQSLLISPQ
jgi:hypothetical protein